MEKNLTYTRKRIPSISNEPLVLSPQNSASTYVKCAVCTSKNIEIQNVHLQTEEKQFV